MFRLPIQHGGNSSKGTCMTPRQRMEIWDRSEGLCEVIENGQRCHNAAQEVDHIIARGVGGRKGAAKKRNNSSENLRAICVYHHRLRHDVRGKLE